MIMQQLSAAQITRCADWAAEMIETYESASEGRGSSGNRASLGVSWGGIETDPIRQQIGKMAECIFCIEHGGDPEEWVRWNTDNPDGDYDFFGAKLRIDVKGTLLRSRCLIWPKGKNYIYRTKKFDILIHTKVDMDGCGRSCGWTTKELFYQQKIVADGSNAPRGFSPGTWFMWEKDIFPIGDLYSRYPTARMAIRAGLVPEFVMNKWPRIV